MSIVSPSSSPVKQQPICYYYNNKGGCKNGDDCPFLHVKDKTAGIPQKCKNEGCPHKTRPGYPICPFCYRRSQDDLDGSSTPSSSSSVERKLNFVSPVVRIVIPTTAPASTTTPDIAVSAVSAFTVVTPAQKVSDVVVTTSITPTHIPLPPSSSSSVIPTLSSTATLAKSESELKQNWGDIEDDNVGLEPLPTPTPAPTERKFVSAKIPIVRPSSGVSRSSKTTSRFSAPTQSDGYTLVGSRKSKKHPSRDSRDPRTPREPRAPTVITCCKRVGVENPVYLRLEYCEQCLISHERSASGSEAATSKYFRIYKCKGKACRTSTPMEYCTRCS